MSTGLTWVAAWDFSSGQEPHAASWIQLFNDYDEAVDFAKWTWSLNMALAGNTSIYLYVYTASPNDNGYVLPSTGVFTVYP